jgi:hypothetical protein
MDPAFFTVRTPHARTHQQQLLVCMHERTGMHEPACMLDYVVHLAIERVGRSNIPVFLKI